MFPFYKSNGSTTQIQIHGVTDGMTEPNKQHAALGNALSWVDQVNAPSDQDVVGHLVHAGKKTSFSALEPDKRILFMVTSGY